ncbi:zinc finger 648-like [Solea senegalensis]|uniref:Zinc finger 648-like n=1 Tax=Solea senegalensis TaxID=28829 RepID=A0AAV6RKZ5_SOLSE|nr:uncharacterized protein si:dkeyp-113d7.10 [Solea senegalensis]KAG7506063.1 zinc finger 648-like [Solea senegalensis]
MNGAVYISFFQGQLESVLEQVVQFAVQEISKTVGSSLNALLLETAVKEQENHRLRLQLQSRENRDNTSAADGGDSPRKRSDEAAESGRTKPEQRIHAPGGQSTEPRCYTDTRRLEQRGRVVGQLKSVMEQVLNFAVRELTKIVEASFDDLLLEITKMEHEQQMLEERLRRSSDAGGEEKGRGGGAGGRRRGSENDSVSPSGSEDAREEHAEVTMSKKTTETQERPPVLSVSQDWFPILDKVFGQKWCSDVLQIKELGGEGGGGGRHEEAAEPLPAPSVTLEPSPSSPQQDPRWTPLEDMEVFSPDADVEPADSRKSSATNATATSASATNATATTANTTATNADANATNAARSSPGLSPGPPLSPAGSSGHHSSASMLHRLLTLPSQLLEDAGEDATARDVLAALENEDTNNCRDGTELPGSTKEGEEEEEEEEDKGRKKKRRRVWSECDECGRRFSRMSLLKAHRQTHVAETVTDTSSPPSPPGAAATNTPLCCSDCGKRFSSVTRLHSHVHTQHPAHQS